MNNLDNRTYAENLCSGKPNPETIARVVSTLNKYGDNKWWLSDDKRIISYFQLNEPIMVVPFNKFREGLEALLGRPVWTHELGLNYEELKNEAANAILGIERTDEERREAINSGIFTLLEHAQKHGKELPRQRRKSMAKTKVTLSLEFVFGHDDPYMPAEDADVLMEHAGDYEFLVDFLCNSSYTLSKKKEVVED